MMQQVTRRLPKPPVFQPSQSNTSRMVLREHVHLNSPLLELTDRV